MGAIRRRLTELMDATVPSVIDADPDVAGWSPDATESYCPRCGASAGPGSVTPAGCPFCVDQRVSWDRITRLWGYAEPMDAWIKAMKFGRQWSWGRWLGERLAERVGEPFALDRVVVVPVPMPWLRRWRRGFNQAQLMADALADARGFPCVPALRRTRHTAPQTSVAASQREANIRGSLAAHPVDLTGHEVVLVDDVKTTGATLAACTRLLKKAGARSVHAAVAAVADPKGQDFKAK
ncbi:MAG: phosphoribosyltransferase family protein [Planctomycetota bacterium]